MINPKICGIKVVFYLLIWFFLIGFRSGYGSKCSNLYETKDYIDFTKTLKTKLYCIKTRFIFE